MKKKLVLNFNRVCEIIEEVNKQFDTEDEDYDVIDERITEYLTIRSMGCPESQMEYLYVSKVIWDGLMVRFRDYDTCTGFDKTMELLEEMFCETENELKSFKESVLVDLRAMVIESE